MRPKNFDVNELIETLQGSCDTLDAALPDGMEFIDLTKDDHDRIDSEIFLCEQCGWWCEQSEANESDGGDVCQDCYDNNH